MANHPAPARRLPVCDVHPEVATICPKCIGANGGRTMTPVKRAALLKNLIKARAGRARQRAREKQA